MNLFDIVIAKALAGGGGGSSITVEPLSVTENNIYTAPEGKAYSPVTVNVSGGSSDFSTAEVTVTNNTNYSCDASFPMIFSEDDTNAIVVLTSIDSGESVLQVPLYKGMVFAIIDTGELNVSTTGDIEFSDFFIITGDGTITIS